MAGSMHAIADSAAIETLAEILAEKVVARLPREGEDRWITSKEAADYLALPISTLRKLTAAGAVPFSQDVAGGRCYFKRGELDRWRRERGAKLHRQGRGKMRPTDAYPNVAPRRCTVRGRGPRR